MRRLGVVGRDGLAERLGGRDALDGRGVAEAFCESVAADHPDATHDVPAYRVRADLFRE